MTALAMDEKKLEAAFCAPCAILELELRTASPSTLDLTVFVELEVLKYRS